MCGIAGAVGAVDQAVVEVVKRMTDAQRHRGPDGEGLWTDAVGPAGVALGHRRLAILDLSPLGAQPMVDPSTGNVIVFNGEIYNFQDLRDELASAGGTFRSRTDTEVLLKSYAAWGETCVDRLRGMFAFAIWDSRRRVVVLARDRLGIKPLYYATVKGAGGQRVLLFASELRALLASERVSRRIDPAGLESYLWNGFVPGPLTILSGARLLPPGSLAVIDPASPELRMREYWTLPVPTNVNGDTRRLRDELEWAGRTHLLSDVPLGVFLSGGVDSSAVTALARRSSAAVRTFNVAFDHAEYDESASARAVAQALGTEHREIRLTEGAFVEQLPDAMESLDQPTFDAINTYFVSRAVRQAGLTVALAGTGGDELFGGYRSFRDIPRAMRVGRRLRMLPRGLLRGLGRGVTWCTLGSGARTAQTRWAKLGDALASRGRCLDLYQIAYALFSPRFIRELLGGTVDPSLRCGLPAERAVQLESMVEAAPPLSAVSLLELSCFLGDRLLRDTDAASMAVSLEVRVPLIDHEVVCAAAGVQPEERFAPLGRKELLKRLAMPGVDPRLFDRPKAGFVLPIELWSRQVMRPRIDELFADDRLCADVGLRAEAVRRLWIAYLDGAPGLYWSRVWALFALLWWCRRHRVSL